MSPGHLLRALGRWATTLTTHYLKNMCGCDRTQLCPCGVRKATVVVDTGNVKRQTPEWQDGVVVWSAAACATSSDAAAAAARFDTTRVQFCTNSA